MSTYTKDQEIIVQRILSYKPHQYYEILNVEKTASDAEIKKSYRKLAIKLHPDKNPHPRASEAFKFLNKAWGVLSDASKKRIFDQTGVDPESRFGGASTGASPAMNPFGNGMSGMRTQGFGSRGFEEDIFNLFFGGGEGFGASNGPTFTFGNNGFTFTSFGDGGPQPFFAANNANRARRQNTETASTESVYGTLRQLLPILLFLVVPLFSALFSGSSPEFAFKETAKFNVPRQSMKFKIPYFVSQDFSSKSQRQKRTFDSNVERTFVEDKRNGCSRERAIRNNLIEDAQGWFSTDQEKLQKALSMKMPDCEALQKLNLI